MAQNSIAQNKRQGHRLRFPTQEPHSHKIYYNHVTETIKQSMSHLPPRHLAAYRIIFEWEHAVKIRQNELYYLFPCMGLGYTPDG